MKDGLRMINITISGMFLLFVIASPLIAANEKVGTDPASLRSARETDVVGTKPCPLPTVDRSDAAILADRMIQRNGSELLFDIRQRDELEEEIRRILLLIRDAHPQVSLIHARAAYVPAMLILGLEPPLMRVINDVLPDHGRTGTLLTSDTEFDTLNAKLELRGIKTFDSIGSVIFCFREGLNIPAAIEAYSTVSGIRYVEPEAFLSDGSDIETLKVNENWFFVFRNAWGDCLSGCIHEEFNFFVVMDGDVRQVDSAASPFRKLMSDRSWRESR